MIRKVCLSESASSNSPPLNPLAAPHPHRQLIQIAAMIASASRPVANRSHERRMWMSDMATYCAASLVGSAPLPFSVSPVSLSADGCGMVMML